MKNQMTGTDIYTPRAATIEEGLAIAHKERARVFHNLWKAAVASIR